jgi:hypothetical protein
LVPLAAKDIPQGGPILWGWINQFFTDDYVSGQKRGLTQAINRDLRRRSAVEEAGCR